MSNYALEGPKWAVSTITWSFASYNYTADASTPFSSSFSTTYQSLVVDAFARWASVSTLSFTQVSDSSTLAGAADIRVGFGNLPTSGEIGVTNYTYSGTSFQPDVLVRLEDPTYTPLTAQSDGTLIYQGTSTSLYQVILHEIGHALGLDHSTDITAVMYPTAGKTNRDLNSSDIAGIQALYGSTVTVPASTQATVTGAGGTVLTLSFALAGLASQAQTQLNAINASVVGGSIVATVPSGTTLASVPFGKSGFAQVSAGGNYALPSGYSVAVSTASAPVSLISAAAGSQLVIASGTGALTYSAVSGVETIYAGTGNALAFGNGASLQFYGGAGAASVVGGTAGNTVTGGIGTMLLFGTSRTTYTGGTAAATVIGGTGGLVANMGAGGGVVFGTPGGGNQLSSGTGNATLVGGGAGDVVVAIGGGSNALVAGSGAETLNGSAASGPVVFFGGTGANSMVGGSGNDLFLPGAANATLTGGGGNNSYAFVSTAGSARVVTITDFDVSRNAIGLFGYGVASVAGAAALSSARISGSSTVVSLSDGTTINFSGAPTLHSYNFF